jgi:hypothetical protein
MVPYTRFLERTLCQMNNNLPHSKKDEEDKAVVEENDVPNDDVNKDKLPLVEPARQISG